MKALCVDRYNPDQQQLRNTLFSWLLLAVNQWSFLTDDVKRFILRIIGHIVKHPDGFSFLIDKDILPTIYCLLKEKLEFLPSGIILGYVDIICNLINHNEGRQWVMSKELWKDIIKFSIVSESLYVKRRSQQMLSKYIVMQNCNVATFPIITGLLNFNKKEINMMNAHDMQNPIRFKSTSNYNNEDKKIILSIYNLLTELFSALLETNYNTNLINELCEQHHIQDLAWTEIHNGDNEDIILAASKLLCLCNISAATLSENGENKYYEENFAFFVAKHFKLLIVRHLFPKVILETCVQYTFLWHRYNSKFDREKNAGEFTRVENLIFLVQAMPMFKCMRDSHRERSEMAELFIDKLFALACPSTVRLCYFYRDQFYVSSTPIETITYHVINSFIRVSSFCEKEQAVMIFQGFMYLLKYFVHIETEDECQNSYGPDYFISSYPELLSSVLSGLTCFLKKFKVSWRDSLETVCLMSFIQLLITNVNVPFLICAEALKLAKLVLLYFIPPNLALLVDTLQGSSMRDLGYQLFKTLGSLHWEVRDSSLEVLQVIGCLAVDKFPAFQALLLEHDLPNVIVSIVEVDCESYVRASALSCLSELVKIQTIWDSYLQKDHVLNTVLSILYFETEGIVRSRAALLIKDICKCRTLPDHSLELIYDTLYYVALNDLHWEVKISALDFWDSVREQIFISIGMVDGSFPDFIFSKEKKKIIQVTPDEISSRLSKALTQLSLNGYLQILWETLHDDCDIQVQRKSAFILKNLMDIINSFKDLYDLTVLDNAELTFNGNEDAFIIDQVSNHEYITSENRISHDEVIDEIVAENDLGLLTGLVQLVEPIKNRPNVNRIAISPSEFLSKIRTVDLNNLLETSTNNYNNSCSLESLLEDILLHSKGYNDKRNDTNSIDCY
ncbi:hypothetical protein O3M35_006254 [Rhynocoris fuscipes]|uniref:BRCA1-associated ATM activator 1 n=1 Tax=Rhynocoris fuscipes TaxID=488301 RepID=A0AAW1DE54_9HEMI